MAKPNIINLRDYKQGKRADFRVKYVARVDKFIAEFVSSRLFEDFIHLAHSYVAQHADKNAATWDYVSLREILQEAMAATIASELMGQLRLEFWFNEKWMSQDEIISRTLSAFVLGPAKPHLKTR